LPRILIFNGTPQTAESRLVEAGSRTYDTLIREAFDCHLADRMKIDYVTLRVADGDHLPQGLSIVDFDGVWISGSPFNAYRPDQPSVQAQIDLVREIWEKAFPHSAHAGVSRRPDSHSRTGTLRWDRVRLPSKPGRGFPKKLLHRPRWAQLVAGSTRTT
jgi:hypothetical protein